MDGGNGQGIGEIVASVNAIYGQCLSLSGHHHIMLPPHP